MRHLLLLRHAKSSWDDEKLHDFDRPLAPRGRRAAPMMGRLMVAELPRPDAVWCSRARRTRQTWDLVAPAYEAVPCVTYRNDLYEAVPEALLSAIAAAPDEIECLLLIGHNPGMEELTDMLAGLNSNPPALRRLKKKFPTAAVAHLETTASAWASMSRDNTRLLDLIRPKDLERD